RFQQLALFVYRLLEHAVAPEVLECRTRRDEGMAIAAEGAVVLARQPFVELPLDQYERERQAISGNGLGHGDDVGLYLGWFEAEKRSGSTGRRLDVVDDEQRTVFACYCRDSPQPVVVGNVEAALALYRFDNYCRRSIDATGPVLQHLLEVQCGVQRWSEVA